MALAVMAAVGLRPEPSGPPAMATGTLVTGTDRNDFLLFEGALQTFSTTITNPYSGEAIVLNATYNVNTAIYDGLAGIDILLMTNVGDVLLLRDPVKNQALFNVERVHAGSGPDVIHLADATFVLGDLFVDGGPKTISSGPMPATTSSEDVAATITLMAVQAKIGSLGMTTTTRSMGVTTTTHSPVTLVMTRSTATPVTI